MNLDPKLVAVVVTAALTRAAGYFGLLTTDPLVESGIALAAGAVAGYFVPNTGTVLRTPQEDGNPNLPDGLES